MMSSSRQAGGDGQTDQCGSAPGIRRTGLAPSRASISTREPGAGLIAASIADRAAGWSLLAPQKLHHLPFLGMSALQRASIPEGQRILHHRLLAALLQHIVEGLNSQSVEGCISFCCQDPQLSPAVQVHADEQSLK